MLNPGDERIIGIEFRTTGDQAYACEHWMEGSGVEWTSVPITWHWLFIEHERELEFAEPITFMAPSVADCAG